jgi:hypothetical protein
MAQSGQKEKRRGQLSATTGWGSALWFPHGIQLLVGARLQRDRKLSQDHPGRPIIVRCISTVPTRRIALTSEARPECPITTRARFVLTGTTVTIMARNLRRERW